MLELLPWMFDWWGQVPETNPSEKGGWGREWVLPGGGADSRDGDFATQGKGAQRDPRATASSGRLNGWPSQGHNLPVTQHCLTRGQPLHGTIIQGEMTL